MTHDENNLFPPDPAPSSASSRHADPATRELLPAELPSLGHSVALENPQLPETFVTADILVPWGWTDLVLFLILAVAGFILVSLLTGLGLAVFGGNVHRLSKVPPDINLFDIFI